MRRGNLQTGGLILNGPQVITIGKRVASGRANNLVLEITAWASVKIPLRWGDFAMVWQGKALHSDTVAAELNILWRPDNGGRMTRVKGVEGFKWPIIERDCHLG